MKPRLVRSTDFQASRNQKPGNAYAKQKRTTASLGRGLTLSWVTMAGVEGFTVVGAVSVAVAVQVKRSQGCLG